MRPGERSKKPWFALLLAAVLLPGISAAAAAERIWYDAPTPLHPVAIDGELTARWIQEGAFVITHEPAAQSNVLAIKIRDGTLVLCSSPFDTEAIRTMLRWIRKVFAPRRIVAINTHFHPDVVVPGHAPAADPSCCGTPSRWCGRCAGEYFVAGLTQEWRTAGVPSGICLFAMRRRRCTAWVPGLLMGHRCPSTSGPRRALPGANSSP